MFLEYVFLRLLLYQVLVKPVLVLAKRQKLHRPVHAVPLGILVLAHMVPVR